MIEDFTDWRIYLLGGQTLIGKQKGGVLSPVYEIQISVVHGPKGSGVARAVIPVLYMNVSKMLAPVGAASFAVDELPRSVQGEFANSIVQAEKILEQLRAAAAGIVIAPPGAMPPRPQ